MISIKQQDIINFLQQISAVAVASHIAVTNPSEDLIKSDEVEANKGVALIEYKEF